MPLSLYLRDEKTGTLVQFPDNNATLIEWDMKSAVGALARKIAAREKKTPHEVLFSSPPFTIVAKWSDDD